MDYLADLIAIGFTEYEAKVYLTLLGENPATGYQLSKKSGIPRSMVYEALGRLNARGAVLRTGDQRTTLYRPVPPDMLLDRFEQEHTRLMENLRTNLNTLYASQDEDHLWSIRGRSSVMAYATQMIQEAGSELLLVLADPALQALHKEIITASERGVTISSLLTGKEDLHCGQSARHPPYESQLQGLTSMLLIVVDNKKCMIGSMDLDLTATITTNRNLVLIARQFVWMELFTQRIYTRLGKDLLDCLDPGDRRIIEGFSV
jgi:sugar-specific transcriptional regulator TrmB